MDILWSLNHIFCLFLLLSFSDSQTPTSPFKFYNTIKKLESSTAKDESCSSCMEWSCLARFPFISLDSTELMSKTFACTNSLALPVGLYNAILTITGFFISNYSYNSVTFMNFELSYPPTPTMKPLSSMRHVKRAEVLGFFFNPRS